MTEPQQSDASSPPAPRKKGGALKLIIRIAVGGAVLGILLARADVGKLWDTLRDANVAYLVGALLAVFAGLSVSALRWQAYLDALEIPLRWATLFRVYFVGTFFNAFLPTGVGGDAYKAMRLGRGRDSLAPAFASVFLDRFAGVVAMAGIGLVASMWLLAGGDDRQRVPLVALGLSILVFGAAAVLLLGGERLLGKGRLIKHEGIGGRIRRAMRQVHAAARHPEAAARGYFYGLVFQMFVFGYHVLVAKALNIDGVPIAAFGCITVISSLATMIPLSINGLGFREGAYIWALGRFGIGHDQALAFALLILAILLLSSLAGGIIYVIMGGEVHDLSPAAAAVQSPPTETE
jgi:hypothetical protein